MPGYHDGADPYGQYTARRFFVSPRWTGTATGERALRRRLRPGHPGAAGAGPGRGGRPRLPIRVRRAAQTVAASGPAYVFGYPSLPPYTGLYANYCAGQAAASASRPGSVRTSCAMTAGDSGGPWLTGFSPRAGAGTVTAVTAFKLSGNLRMLYAPCSARPRGPCT